MLVLQSADPTRDCCGCARVRSAKIIRVSNCTLHACILFQKSSLRETESSRRQFNFSAWVRWSLKTTTGDRTQLARSFSQMQRGFWPKGKVSCKVCMITNINRLKFFVIKFHQLKFHNKHAAENHFISLGWNLRRWTWGLPRKQIDGIGWKFMLLRLLVSWELCN